MRHVSRASRRRVCPRPVAPAPLMAIHHGAMSLFLIRHAHAVSAEEDPERPLSKRGQKQIRALARFLRETHAFDCPEIWHSPLARSRQTAERLIKHLGLAAKPVEVSGLEGDDNPGATASQLKARRRPLAIVGHEPHLSALASLLVAGVAEPRRFVLKKCAALALEHQDGVWAVRWQISPEIVN